MKTLLILSHDLSIQWNTSLSEAALNDETILPVYISDSKIEELGGASLLWIRKSLEEMSRLLSIEQIPIFFTHGDFIRIIHELCKNNRCDGIRTQNVITPGRQTMLDEIRDYCSRSQIKFICSEPNQLLSPEQLKTASVNFNQFSAFYEKMKLRSFEHHSTGDLPEIAQISQKEERYRYASWEKDLAQHWDISENAIEKLFVSNVSESPKSGEKISERGLSPYIRHGQASVREFWERSEDYNTERSEEFRRNLVWREFYTLSYLRRPWSRSRPFNDSFERFPWSPKWNDLLEWKLGKTGFSMIDAAMTQLWKTGWIPNNLRMLVADFLVKLKLINWGYGAQWFMDTLVDADEASNYSSWQWITGTGGFNWPFLRIFNPLKKARELDPDTSYRKKWLKDNDLYETEEFDDKNMELKYRDLRARALSAYRTFNNSLKG